MDIKNYDAVLIILACIILVLVFVKFTGNFSTYATPSPAGGSKTVYDLIISITNIDDRISLQTNLFKVLKNQINTTLDSYKTMNEIITTANKYTNTKLVPYTDETSFFNMFNTAWQNGEGNLSVTDKFVLRFFNMFSTEIEKLPWGSRGLPSLTFSAEGLPTWGGDVLGSNYTPSDFRNALVKVLDAYLTFFISGAQVSSFNSLLPTNLPPFRDQTDFNNRVATLYGNSPSSSSLDATMVWFIKYISVGFLYISWVSKNKWKLDPNFTIS